MKLQGSDQPGDGDRRADLAVGDGDHPDVATHVRGHLGSIGPCTAGEVVRSFALDVSVNKGVIIGVSSVVLVGAVITLNVALGGMKGITLVQAFQYWAKMFAISVPIFVLMAVYGHYGKQLEVNGNAQRSTSKAQPLQTPVRVQR